MKDIRKFQKPLLITAFVLSAILFFYTLGYSSSLYQLYFFGDPISASRYVPGAEIYSEIQPFNRTFLGLATAELVLCITMFITFTQKRRIFYPSNYITVSAFSALTVFNAIDLIIHNVEYKAKYLSIDFELYEEVVNRWSIAYAKPSTFIFDFGYVLAALSVLTAVALIVMLFAKRKQRAEELRLKEKIYEASSEAGL